MCRCTQSIVAMMFMLILFLHGETRAGESSASVTAPQGSQQKVDSGEPKESAVESNDDLEFSVEELSDRLRIRLGRQHVADFIFHDENIYRPYFAHVRTPGGIQVTRNHPPVEVQDATDHGTMHPGIWLAFGDVSGVDFWRNKGHIEHVRFVNSPVTVSGKLTFATESKLMTPDDREVCRLLSHFTLIHQPGRWLIVWNASFRSDHAEFTFGDQEEMGFGARVTTSLAEKNGGLITSSTGLKSASGTWGQPAKWCDYSGPLENQNAGITLMADPHNFRESWWHNRDYGAFVANLFGRAAMKQGEVSSIRVKPGESFRIRFAACLHDSPDYSPADAFQTFVSIPPESTAEPTRK